MFYASSGMNGGFLLDYPGYNVFLYSDFYPNRFGGTRTDFFRKFLRSVGSRRGVEIIAATPSCRVLALPREDKMVLFLFMDNNDALEVIWKSGIPIEGFCGYCDGCCEGGNYECANDMPFMSKVLSLTDKHLEIITDHAPGILGISWGEAWLPAVVKGIKFPRGIESGGRKFRVTHDLTKIAPFDHAQVFNVDLTDTIDRNVNRLRRRYETPFSLK
jgi:hypothetical protein